MTVRVRLYGPARGEHSFAVVTRGMRQALEAAGRLAGFCATDDVVRDDEPGEGQDAEIALVTGPPTGLNMAHAVGAHRAHWLLLAPNGNRLPRGFAERLMEPGVTPRGLLTGGLLAPSLWAAGVLAKEFPGRRVIVAPHGVARAPELSPEPRQRDAEYTEGSFRMLHMTSTESERKGTRALFEGLRSALNQDLVPRRTLLLVIGPVLHLPRLHELAQQASVQDHVILRPGLLQSAAEVHSLLARVHLVCQPSRAEGFGLVPLEALVNGTPVLATICTGHSEYLSATTPGLTVVPYGAAAPLDDFPGSTAPSVDRRDVADALGTAYSAWLSKREAALAAAPALFRTWGWAAKNQDAIQAMCEHSL